MSTEHLAVEETWNLGDIFSGDDAFRKAREAFAAEIPGLERFRGRLGKSATVLREALDEVTETGQRFQMLRCYSALKSDEDIRDSTYQAMRQEVELLATRFSGAIAYLRPEILGIEPQTIEQFIAEDPGLAVHAHFLRDLLRQRDHVLSPGEERILSESSMLTRTPNSLFEVLNNVELPRPNATLASGETVRLTPVEFQKHRTTPDRDDRQKIFHAYYRSYESFAETFAQNLFASVKGDLFRARTRGYDSCLAAALHPDNVPVDVFHSLIREVRDALPILHRYLKARTRALGLDRFEYSDLYCPLTGTPPRRYSTADAREVLLSSLGPLGEEYVGDLAGGLEARWADWHPGTGKRSGAYSTGWAYSVHPYVLLNYIGDAESVSTLAHEMGHAMHSFFSNRAQTFATADYPIFLAEVASTVNEVLLNRRMLELAESDQEKLFLLGRQLDGFRGTMFRQTMFAEFELAIHSRAEAGEVLTGESLNALYLDLLRVYHGHDGESVRIAENYAVEWAAIPHLHYNFYVYQYATGIVAALALVRGLLSGDEGARARYLEFLSAGGSDYPLSILRRAGVDLESPEPYRAALDTIRGCVEQVESLLGITAAS